MKISTKGRYGIRALIDLAVNSTNGHVSLVNIANRNQISVHYLEHVFSSLKRGGIVKSVKGAQGGYVLADKPENITVAQMILALEGSYSIEPESVNEDALVKYPVSSRLSLSNIIFHEAKRNCRNKHIMLCVDK